MVFLKVQDLGSDELHEPIGFKIPLQLSSTVKQGIRIIRWRNGHFRNFKNHENYNLYIFINVLINY